MYYYSKPVHTKSHHALDGPTDPLESRRNRLLAPLFARDARPVFLVSPWTAVRERTAAYPFSYNAAVAGPARLGLGQPRVAEIKVEWEARRHFLQRRQRFSYLGQPLGCYGDPEIKTPDLDRLAGGDSVNYDECGAKGTR